MRRVFRDKLFELVRGEEGVAFVVTLAVFFFMYLLIAGVYAVGTSVRERIHLQNACDAAAYSAAVVQADMLSRIATINRAMSWTYAQVTRRQMDWITKRWLAEACSHFEDDYVSAKYHAGLSTALCSDLVHHRLDFRVGWNGLDGMMLITGSGGETLVSKDVVADANDRFKSEHVGGDDTFYYDRSSMTEQIRADWQSIADMGDRIEDLKKDYKKRIKTAATVVLEANLDHLPRDRWEPWVDCSESANAFMKQMDVNQEDRFLAYEKESADSAFKKSGQTWFVQAQTDKGFLRRFREGVLKVEWHWYSKQWHCKKTPFGADVHIGPFPCMTCGHGGHENCSCEYNPLTMSWHATVWADNDRSKDGANKDYYETPDDYAAKPEILKPEYFGKEGTITVGLAVKNENPWCSVMRLMARPEGQLSGLFAAFNHFCEKTVVFSSAKAGYKFLEEDEATGVRGYRIDWMGSEDAWQDRQQSWNLCQSDWDAVMVPVRMAKARAQGGEWVGRKDFLLTLVRQLKVDDDEMLSGGEHQPPQTALDESLDTGHYHMTSLREEYAGGTGRVESRWRIGKPHQHPTWDKLTDRMFH